MKKVGVLKLNSDCENELDFFIKKNGYELLEVNDTNDIISLDALIIDLRKETDFSNVYEWLMFSQENSKAYIWLIISEIESSDTRYFFELGVNGIVNEEDNFGNLFLLIRNNFNRIDLLNAHQDINNPNEIIFLNERNFSVILYGKTEIMLTKSEYSILNQLYENKNKTISYLQIYQCLWHEEYTDKKKYRIANLVFQLRKKIELNNEKFIQTISSIGYRLII